MKDYGYAIRTLRKKNQMTQQALADNLNISGQAVSKWENNLAQPDLDTVLKMTEIFGITLNEFTALCSSAGADIDGEQTADEAQSAENVGAGAPRLFGVCFDCGSSIYNEEEIGEKKPKLICKACKQARIDAENAVIAEKERKRMEKKQEVVSDFRRALIIPGIVIGIILALLAVLLISSVGFKEALSSCLVLALIALITYTMVVQIMWDGVVSDIFYWAKDKSFSMPGLIFTLDLDGLIWFIVVKIGLTILSLLLSLIVAVIGTAFCLVISPFIFPFALIANIKEIKEA